MFYRTLSLRLLLALALVGSVTVLSACDSNDPEDEGGAGEQEIISEVTLTLNGDDGSTVTAVATFDEGGVEQSVDRITLTSGVTYDGSVELLDTFNDEDITEEVREEAAEHQFFYVPTVAGVTATVTDSESDYGDTEGADLPVGLTFEVVVADGAAGNGTMRVVLGHYDERAKQPGETPDAAPETDVDFEFPLTVN